MSCGHLRPYLHRDAAVLDDAARLQLERHLAGCADCRRDRELLLRARAAPVASIGARGHQRAIARALLEGAPASASVVPVVAPAGRSRRVIGGAIFGFAAAAALVGWLVTRGDDSSAAEAPVTATLVDAGVAADPIALAAIDAAAPAPDLAPPPVVRDQPLRLAAGEVVRFPAVVVTAQAAAELVIAADGETVTLTAGRVEIEVDPAAGLDFRLHTPRFTVEVTGTIFAASTDEVSVSRGSVRVVSPRGAVLVPHLTAGQRWRFVEPPPPKPRVTAGPLLTRAREAFTRRDFAGAIREADQALAASPTTAQDAEARMLRAESALATGDVAAAINGFRSIVDRHADLPAGETALFALARLELRRGHPTAGQRWLDEYLRRYPAGRYAADVRRMKAPR